MSTKATKEGIGFGATGVIFLLWAFASHSYLVLFIGGILLIIGIALVIYGLRKGKALDKTRYNQDLKSIKSDFNPLYCRYCGKELPSPDADICTNCGKFAEKTESTKVRTGKKSAVIGAIFSVLALVFMIAYFANSYNITQQNVQQANESYNNALSNMDDIVSQAIAHCESHSDDQSCDTIMKQWYDQCKTDAMKDVPSCHNGMIESYLKAKGLL